MSTRTTPLPSPSTVGSSVKRRGDARRHKIRHVCAVRPHTNLPTYRHYQCMARCKRYLAYIHPTYLPPIPYFYIVPACPGSSPLVVAAAGAAAATSTAAGPRPSHSFTHSLTHSPSHTRAPARAVAPLSRSFVSPFLVCGPSAALIRRCEMQICHRRICILHSVYDAMPWISPCILLPTPD